METEDEEVVERRTSRRAHRHALEQEKRNPWWKDILIGVGTAIILLAVVRAFFIQQFQIPSESMEDTLLVGDHILVSKMKNLQPIERGDIVVFEDRHNWLPEAYKHPPRGFDATAMGQAVDKTLRFLQIRPEYPGGYLVKRVLGVGGDHVSCCNSAKQIMVNGVPLKEPYLKANNAKVAYPFDVVVPKGKYWVMGDNRDNSGDSRYHQDDPTKGFLDENQMVGKVLMRYYPLARLRTFHNPGLNKLPPAKAKSTKKAPPAKGKSTQKAPPEKPKSPQKTSPAQAPVQ